MLQVLVFAIVLALIYAAKAISVSRQHEQLAQNATAFDYMRMRSYKDIVESAETAQVELAEIAPRSTVNAPAVARRVTA